MWVILHKLSCLVGIDRSRWDSSLLLTAFLHKIMLQWTRWEEFVNPNRKSIFDIAATPLFLQTEILSGNVCTSARGLAAIANVLSQRDPNFFKGDGLEMALANDDCKPMLSSNDTTLFNDGGWAHFMPNDHFRFDKVGINNAIGWIGWNGSITIFHPDGDLALAFNPVAFGDFLSPTSRQGRLISSFAKCFLASSGDK